MSLDYSIPLTRVNGALMQQNLKKQAHLMGFAKSVSRTIFDDTLLADVIT